MNALEVITAKRNGERLSPEQISWFIDAYTKGVDVADEQAAALAMAIYFQGMEADELATWTKAMIDSGRRLDLSGFDRPVVDKHSTGGVGDKISLILVPLAVACGLTVPQLSGRGLGHTGGTLDKMEAISGWQAQIEPGRLKEILATVGGVIAGASDDLAPADRKLYALRDVTGTVESIPLIASSIMSKKIAEGTDALVLDVKVGSGAFMTDFPAADQLARTMVEIGKAQGVNTSALVTRMDSVLGRTVGNALEVQEALEVLEGGGPLDVIELTIALVEEMLSLGGVDGDPAAILASGKALATFDDMVTAQGGSLSAGLPESIEHELVVAERAGYIQEIEARAVGVGAWLLGAGRARKEDSVSQTAGIICHAKPGDWVEAGAVVLELRADEPTRFEPVRQRVQPAITIADTPPDIPALIIERIG